MQNKWFILDDNVHELQSSRQEFLEIQFLVVLYLGALFFPEWSSISTDKTAISNRDTLFNLQEHVRILQGHKVSTRTRYI